MKATLAPSSAAVAPVSTWRLAARAEGMRPSAIREILKATERPEVISFAGGLPAPELFPVADVGRAVQAVMAEEAAEALQYGVTEGHGPLREWVCAHLRGTVGLSATADQVLITSGAQQALDLLAKVLLDPGDVVLVENPAYLGAIQAFRAYEARVVGLPSDAEGIRPDALENFLRTSPVRPKFLYLVANFQNPTGTSTSLERRRAISALAAKFGLPVVDDDPYGRLRYSGCDLPAMGASPEADGYLYLGTSSKIMAPGLRVAWMVVSDARLYARLVTAKQSADLHTSSFTQRVVWRYVRQTDRLDAQLARLRRAYGARRDAMLAALERHLPPGCSWTRPEGGLFLWARLPEGIDTVELLAAATRQKVAFVPGSPFWVGTNVRHTLRLNFSHANEAKIEEGIERLGRVVAQRVSVFSFCRPGR